MPDNNPQFTTSEDHQTVSLPRAQAIAGIGNPQVVAHNLAQAATPNTIARLTSQFKAHPSKSYGVSSSPNANLSFSGFQPFSHVSLRFAAVQQSAFSPKWFENNGLGQNTAMGMVSPTVNQLTPLSGAYPTEPVLAQQVPYGSSRLTNPISPQSSSPLVTPVAQWDPSRVKIEASQGVQMVHVDLRSEGHKNDNSIAKRCLGKPDSERPSKFSKTSNVDQTHSVIPKAIPTLGAESGVIAPTTVTSKPFPTNIILPKELAFLSATTGAPMEGDISSTVAVETYQLYPSARMPFEIETEAGNEKDDNEDDDEKEEEEYEQERDYEDDDDIDTNRGGPYFNGILTCLYTTIHHGPFPLEDEATQVEFAHSGPSSAIHMPGYHMEGTFSLHVSANADSGGAQEITQEPVESVEPAHVEPLILRTRNEDIDEHQKVSAEPEKAVKLGNRRFSSTDPTLLEKSNADVPHFNTWTTIVRPPKDLTSDERRDKKTFIRWQRDNARYQASLGKKGPFEIGHYLCDVNPSNGAILKIEARVVRKQPGGSY